jgi:hypothetical protein
MVLSAVGGDGGHISRMLRATIAWRREHPAPVTPGSLILARPTNKNTQRHLVHEEPDGSSSSNPRS